MSKNNFMGLLFTAMLLSCFLGGFIAVDSGAWVAGFVSLILGFVSMFVGMILKHMSLYDPIRRHFISREIREKEFKEKIDKLLHRQDNLQREAIVDGSESVTKKVVYRILSEHFDMISDDSKRIALFAAVDKVIEEESDNFRNAFIPETTGEEDE